MPNGRTHDGISLFTAPIMGIGTYLITTDIKITLILSSAYIFASFMFNRDLDTNSKPYNRWWLFKVIWVPYQIMFQHRSVFTHGIIIGTAVRLIYLLAIPFIILAVKHNLGILTTISIAIWLPIVIGLELGSAVHTISDKIF